MDYIAINVLFYFINLFPSKGLMVNFHIAGQDKHSRLVFMKFI